MSGRLTDLAYSAGWSGVRHLPEPVARAGFARIADTAWRRRGASVRQLERNLARVVPEAGDAELRQLSRAGMRSYLRYWCEAFRLPSWSPQEVVERIVVTGEPRLRDPLAEGRGVVAVLGHLGNWDHAGAWAATVDLPFTTVAERLRPESLFRRFLDYRESLGMEVLPLSRDGDVTMTLRRRLEAGRIVALVADRDLTRGGLEVDLLGEPARFPAGPAALALRTGSVLLPVVSWYDDDRMHLDLLPEIEPPAAGRFRDRVQTMTQGFADVIGTAIRQHPADWHMLQPVWLADLDPARLHPPAEDVA